MTFELGVIPWSAILTDPDAPQFIAAIEKSQWQMYSGAPIDWDLLARQPTNLRAAESQAPYQLSYGFPYVGNIYHLIDALSQLWVRNITELDQSSSNPRITFVPFDQSPGIAARILLKPSWYIAPSNHPVHAVLSSVQGIAHSGGFCAISVAR